MATIADYVRVTENLAYSYQKGHADNFFDPDSDAFLAHCEDIAESDNGGAGFVVHCVTRGNQNANATYTLAGTGAAGRHKFIISPVNVEWKATWSRDAQLAAESKGTAAMFDLAKEEIDIAMNTAKLDIAKFLGGKGYGALAGVVAINSLVISIGQPDGNAAGDVVPALTNRFYVGQELVAADDDDSGDLRGADPGTVYTVTAKDPSAGTITLDATTNLVDGDYLIARGYRHFSATSGPKTITGLEGWINRVVGDSLGGTTLTAGLVSLKFDASSYTTISDALMAADEYAFSQPDMVREGLAIFVSPQQFRQLSASTEARAQVVKGGVTRSKANGDEYTIGFSQFMLTGMGAQIPVIPSRFVRPGTAAYGPFKSKKYGFKLAYAGGALLNITIPPGGNAIRLADSGVTNNTGVVEAGFKVEGFFRGNLLCKHPGNYMWITGLNESA
jgi:hypothetical protein